MMLFCPLKSGYVIDVTAIVTTDKKASFQLSGAGASTALISTPYVYDNGDIANEHESKAFIAAIANITNKLIHHIESVKVPKSQEGYATQHEEWLLPCCTNLIYYTAINRDTDWCRDIYLQDVCDWWELLLFNNILNKKTNTGTSVLSKITENCK